MTETTECNSCKGKGTILDNDGEDMACPDCDGTGVSN